MRVKLNGLAEHRWISRIMRLPEAIAQDGSRSAATTHVIGGGKCSSNRSPYAECAEEIAADPQAVDETALAASRHVEPVQIPGEHAGEDVLPAAQGFPHRVCKT